MNASEARAALEDFDPRELIGRAKRRRDFSARFDAFSDAYVWVLAAVVALAYLFSALFGMLYVLLGQGVPHQELPSAVWSIKDLSFVLLALGGIAIFRLMAYLGPCGLSAAKADWWLPLPISLQLIRWPAWRNAVLTGLFASLFAGVLWLIILLGLAGEVPGPVAGLSLACFALAGMAMANMATAMQAMDLPMAARRISAGAAWGIIGMLAVLWLLLIARIQWAQAFLEALAAAAFEPFAWIIALALAVFACAASAYWASRKFGEISGQELRRAGGQQQLAMGTMMQGDSRGIASPSESALKRRRLRGSRLTARLPVIWRILLLRMLRGSRWRPAAVFCGTVLVLVATVHDVANPLSAAASYLGLCVVLTLSTSGMIAPLLAEQQLAQHLGVSTAQLVRTATLFAAGFSAAALIALTCGLRAFGILELDRLGQWCAALLVAALGSAAASSAHARRGERDWSTLLGSASNDATIATFLFLETATYLRAAATYAPVLFLVLSPDAPIAWLLWITAVLFAGSALAQIFRRH